MAKRYIAPKLMSHEERRRLIEAPFNCYIIGRKSSGGTSLTSKNAHYYPGASDDQNYNNNTRSEDY